MHNINTGAGRKILSAETAGRARERFNIQNLDIQNPGGRSLKNIAGPVEIREAREEKIHAGG